MNAHLQAAKDVGFFGFWRGSLDTEGAVEKLVEMIWTMEESGVV